MPELPEVETVRRTLEPRLIGRSFTALDSRDFPEIMGPLGLDNARSRVLNRPVKGVNRRAKYLFVMFDEGDALMIHLRMTGRVEVVPGGAPVRRFEHLAMMLDNGEELRYSDQRKFGRVEPKTGDEIILIDNRLGPEPLGDAFTPDWLTMALRRRSARLKSVLLDQAVIAGLGNIYADEALFRARLHPERVARDLDALEIARLHEAVRTVLWEGLENRGTTFDSFQDASGREGANQHNLRVYGRGGKGQCIVCGGPILRLVTGGRGTSYCPVCQPESIPGVTITPGPVDSDPGVFRIS